jgi:hypothetical protein
VEINPVESRGGTDQQQHVSNVMRKKSVPEKRERGTNGVIIQRMRGMSEMERVRAMQHRGVEEAGL